jgi:hypothetical protein
MAKTRRSTPSDWGPVKAREEDLMFDTAVPLELIENGLKASGKVVERDGTCLRVNGRLSGFLGETLVDVRPVRVGTVDGEEISDILTIRTDLLAPLDSLDEQTILGLNAFAGISAVMEDPVSHSILAGSRLSVYVGDEDAWRLHLPLVLLSADLQTELLLRQLVGLDETDEGPAAMDLPESGEPSRWDEAEFDYAARFLTGRGLLCTADGTGLTVEFPWEPQGKSVALGHVHENLESPRIHGGTPKDL